MINEFSMWDMFNHNHDYYPKTGDELLTITDGIYNGTYECGRIYLAATTYEINRPLLLASNCALIGKGRGLTTIKFAPESAFDFDDWISNHQDIAIPSSKAYYTLTYRFPTNHFRHIDSSTDAVVKDMYRCSNRAIVMMYHIDKNNNIVTRGTEVSHVQMTDLKITVAKDLNQGNRPSDKRVPDYGILGNIHVKQSCIERVNIEGALRLHDIYNDTSMRTLTTNLITNNLVKADQLKVGMFFPYVWGSTIQGCRVNGCECGFAINGSTSLQYTFNYSWYATFVGHTLYDIHYSEISSCAVDKLNPSTRRHVFGYAYRLSNVLGSTIHDCGAEWCNGSYMYIEALTSSTISDCISLEQNCPNDSAYWGGTSINGLYQLSDVNYVREADFYVTPLFALSGSIANSCISNITSINLSSPFVCRWQPLLDITSSVKNGDTIPASEYYYVKRSGSSTFERITGTVSITNANDKYYKEVGSTYPTGSIVPSDPPTTSITVPNYMAHHVWKYSNPQYINLTNELESSATAVSSCLVKNSEIKNIGYSTTGNKALNSWSTDVSGEDIMNVSNYVLTSDTTFQSGVTYYTRVSTASGWAYNPATVTTGTAVTANTYYIQAHILDGGWELLDM